MRKNTLIMQKTNWIVTRFGKRGFKVTNENMLFNVLNKNEFKHCLNTFKHRLNAI